MKENLYKAFAEVEAIINNSEKEVQNRVPDSFKDFLNKYKEKNYEINLDFSKDINEQKLLEETRQILALIYRDFLCSKDEKRAIIRLNQKNKDMKNASS